MDMDSFSAGDISAQQRCSVHFIGSEVLLFQLTQAVTAGCFEVSLKAERIYAQVKRMSLYKLPKEHKSLVPLINK